MIDLPVCYPLTGGDEWPEAYPKAFILPPPTLDCFARQIFHSVPDFQCLPHCYQYFCASDIKLEEIN